MVRELIPFPRNFAATGSHDLRVVLHMCSKITPGPGLLTERKVARSLIPSRAVMSTSLREAVWAGAKLVNAKRDNDRNNRGMRCPSKPAAKTRSFGQLRIIH